MHKTSWNQVGLSYCRGITLESEGGFFQTCRYRGATGVWTQHLLLTEKENTMRRLGVCKFKRKAYSTLCCKSSGRENGSGLADVLAGVCIWLLPLLLLLCTWNSPLPLTKFPAHISTLLPAVFPDTSGKINLSCIPRVLHVYFYSRTCHIVLQLFVYLPVFFPSLTVNILKSRTWLSIFI